MPGYCKEALVRFVHKVRKVKNQPHRHTVPVYEQNIYEREKDKTPELDKERGRINQQVSGTFLYYKRAVHLSMLVVLSTAAAD